MPETLFDKDGYRVEFHGCGRKSDGVVYSFTPYRFRNPDNEGSGVRFLLAEGYDVVSFKSVRDSWYQDLPRSGIEAAAAIGKAYGRRATYGASMGGFAAIAFADLLSASDVIAISPQYSIRDAFDARWAREAAAIPAWNFEIQAGSCRNCRVTIVYDDLDPRDRMQVERIVERLGTAEMHEVKVPLGGHPVGVFLHETGQRKEVVRSILNREENPRIRYTWSELRTSYAYNLSLGQHAERAGRKELAFLCFSRGFRLSGGRAECGLMLIRLLIGMGRVDEALEYAERVAALHGDNAAVSHKLSVMLRAAGRAEAAIAHGRRAAELAPENAVFRRHLTSLLEQAGRR